MHVVLARPMNGQIRGTFVARGCGQDNAKDQWFALYQAREEDKEYNIKVGQLG